MEAVPSKQVFAAPPAEPVGTQLITLDPKKYVEEVFASFTQRLAAAKAEAAGITVVDVSTKAGMALAVKHRAVFRAIRIEAENERVARKRPILDIGKLLDSRNNEIAAEVSAEEERFDNAIKADEIRKEAERQARIRAEQERLAAEERARKEAEEKKLADERAELARQKAELEREQAAHREAREKEAREHQEAAAKVAKALDDAARESRLRIEQEERAARLRRDEEDRAARAAREEAERKAREQQERNQAALSEITGIQQQVIIASCGRAGVRSGGTIECIEATLAETEAWPIDAERFGVFTEAAFKAKETAVDQIRTMLAAAKARAAEDAKAKEERDRLEKERLAAEGRAAAERRAEEDRARAQRDRVEAEARARAEEERKARIAEEERQREEQRRRQLSLDAHDMLVAWVEQYGDLKEYAEITADIKAFLADVPNPVPA